MFEEAGNLDKGDINTVYVYGDHALVERARFNPRARTQLGAVSTSREKAIDEAFSGQLPEPLGEEPF